MNKIEIKDLITEIDRSDYESAVEKLSTLNHKFLLIQGRSIPQTDNSMQYFPSNWKEEFPIINKLGFSGIE